MKCGIVRYDRLTSFETLAHTFPMFLPSQLSACNSQGFLKNAMANFLKKMLKKNRLANFFQHFQKNRGHNYTVWWLLNPESCWRLLVCNQWKFYIRPRYCLRTAFWFFIFSPKNNFSPWRIFKNLENFMQIIGMEETLEKCGPKFQMKSNDGI